MEAEIMPIEVCPLCRQSAGADRKLATRLCKQCRLMIDLIRPTGPVTIAQHAAHLEVMQPEHFDLEGSPESDAGDLMEWPLLVDAPRSARRSGLLRIASAALLIACGTVIYLVGMKGWFKPTQPAGAELAPGASSKLDHTDQLDQPKDLTSTLDEAERAKIGAEADQQSQPNDLASSVGVEATGQKLLTIQAAAFPSRDTAAAFSEKLARAGIPTYIVSADIAHRGKWFRVRAGRFSSREEASTYLRAWQQQAAAAGISVRFVITDYD
jgi:cell division septation protein DedD